jgi:SAM-dependent methyltransferase
VDLFPEQYHYRSRFTGDVLKGMADLVDSCRLKFGDLRGKTVIDIGCNDGSLLDLFRENGATTIGIEPTGASQDAREKGHEIYNTFLSTDVAQKIADKHGALDFITFTNVFAHIEDLKEVFSALKLLMGPNTLLVIENHYLGAVLRGNQFDTFYHEHPRTYSLSSFRYIARELGVYLMATEFPERYGGNIRVFLGNSKDLTNTETFINKEEGQFLEEFASLREKISLWRTNKKLALYTLAIDNGKLRAKAFPGRAAILVKLLNPMSCLQTRIV